MPRGGHVFGDVVFYDVLPPKFSITIGVDLAYSEKTHADYSVAVVMGHHGKDSYILDVVRVQEKAPQFRTRLASLKARWPGASWCAYLGGTEKGVADLFHQFGVDLGARRPRGDKFVRAQPVAAAWNAGRILLPRKALWLNPVVDEIKNFTGVKDPHDDVIDALAASYDAARPEREHTVNSDTVRAILQSQFRNSVPRVSPVAGLPGAEAMHEGPQRWGGAGLSAYLANTVGPY
jgi:predicted phage terminase large subunit-like protein